MSVCQQNVSLLEAEEKTMEQLGIEDGTQVLIEGNHCAAAAATNTTVTATFDFV